LKTTGVHEKATATTATVDVNRFPSSVEVDVLNKHVVRIFTAEVKQLIEVGFAVTLCDIGGIFETFDGARSVGVENRIVQARAGVRCDKPEIVELFLVFLARLELSVK
jgi:hypothetical protein